MEASKLLPQHLIGDNKWHNSETFHIKRHIVIGRQGDQAYSRKNEPGSSYMFFLKWHCLNQRIALISAVMPDENTACDA